MLPPKLCWRVPVHRLSEIIHILHDGILIGFYPLLLSLENVTRHQGIAEIRTLSVLNENVCLSLKVTCCDGYDFALHRSRFEGVNFVF